MSKPNNIRKKALDYAKKRQWDKALEEFTRLVEIEQHNPNLFNEIGDIHLKLGNKREAFRHYHEAIDAYAKVGLHNNAVAVCKKILRLNPSDDVVYGKMATLRHRQGFGREAVAYSVTFLDKILGIADLSGEHLQALVVEIAEIAQSAPEVLERAAEFLLRCQADREAGTVLEKLERHYDAQGLSAECQRIRAKMDSIGYVPTSAAAPSPEPDKLETVESARQHRGGSGGLDASFTGAVPPHIRRGHDEDVATDFGLIDVEIPNPAPAPAGPQTTRMEEPRVASKEYVIGEEDLNGGLDTMFGDVEGDGSVKARAAGLTGGDASEVRADVDEGDHRSHYDLGMAYLEMGLLTEAVREFQFAANSPTYQVRSLEMIGRCFISQNQPKLAIKQLSKGLDLVRGDDRTGLGIKYSLALAYEMTGEIEQAKALFEDVYVVDVTFRDVEEKVKKYTS